MTFRLKAYIAASSVLVSLLLAFTYTRPIKGLKASYYLIFVHPPLAWAAYICFVMAAIWAMKFLRQKSEDFALKSHAVMAVGYLFIIVAAFSGMAWGQLYWGDIGMANADPRFISIIFVLIMYSAYFILRNAISTSEARRKIASLYTLICLPFATFFIFVLPRIRYSLHPDNPILNMKGKGRSREFSFGLENMLTLLIALIGVLIITHLIYTLRYRIEKLEYIKEEELD